MIEPATGLFQIAWIFNLGWGRSWILRVFFGLVFGKLATFEAGEGEMCVVEKQFVQLLGGVSGNAPRPMLSRGQGACLSAEGIG